MADCVKSPDLAIVCIKGTWGCEVHPRLTMPDTVEDRFEQLEKRVTQLELRLHEMEH